MVRKYLRKKKTAYSEKDIQLAIEAVRDGMEVATAAKTFMIPRSTLRDKLSGRRQRAKRPGAKTVFTTEQEKHWLIDSFICLIVAFL